MLRTCTCASLVLGLLAAAGALHAGGGQAAGGSREWQSLFDGKTLTNWARSDFFKPGEVKIQDGEIRLGAGTTLTGIRWVGPELPRTNYEISLKAMKIAGNDFFCGLTFPVGDSHCTLIAGGWGGMVVGLSSIDSEDASQNETTSAKEFDKGRWYAIRVRVTPPKIEAWIDDKPVVDFVTTGREIDVRFEMNLSIPLGIASYQTEAAIRDIKVRKLE